MLSKKYLPNIGFIIFIVTIISSILFVKWAIFFPFAYEKAAWEEQKAHWFFKNGKIKKAHKYFLAAAQIKDDDISTSRRYRLAGSTSSSYKNKIKYFKLALKYNSNNKNAKDELNPYFTEIIYNNRSPDGWSLGDKASIILNVNNKDNYTLTYFTYSPKKIVHKIKVLLNGKILFEEEITQNKVKKFNFLLKKGMHKLDISTNETWNPLKLGISKDNRNLGIHFEIEKRGK